ncbi:MAG: response regulator [Thiomargarita sp.]|nr:response regulator [Thiomargarita sp.]
MKIRTKLLPAALAISLIPALIIGIFSVLQTREALTNQAFSHLESVRDNKKAQLETFFTQRMVDMQVLLEMVDNLKQNAAQKLQSVQENKKAQIEWYFQERMRNIQVFSKSDLIAEAIERFDKAFHADKFQTTLQTENHISDKLKQYQQTYSYDDLFLIAQDGDVVYTTEKRNDLGQNVRHGMLKDSPLGNVFQKGLHGTAIQDFSPYAPANNQYIAFITTPLFKANKLIGVLAFSFSADTINTIVQKNKGMGKTGGSYLVGKFEGKISYRSNRITKGKEAKIGEEKHGVELSKSLEKKSGITLQVGSTGVVELCAYAPLQIPGLNWAIITTIALEEVITPKGEKEDFFTYYIRKYNYHDLFLIHPNGKIFYSVKHESDYNTNILTGKYADSQLGLLIKKVLQSNTFEISDFAPYAPSFNEPAAFIAQPLHYHDFEAKDSFQKTVSSEVELIVALQLSDKAISQIMLQRSGMGNTGETYLVGKDKLMRSNSWLDPIYHSVKASFANPILGAVDTEATRAALSGETSRKITRDYRNNLVLSAYTPINVGDTKWAVIAEINAEEALKPIIQLEWLLGLITLLIVIIVWLLISHFTKRLTSPLLLLNDHLKMLAQGKMIEEEIKYAAKDEIGELVISACILKDNFKNMIAQANAIAAGDYKREVKLFSKQDQLGKALSDMTQQLQKMTALSEKQNWLKTGQNKLNKTMRGDLEITLLARKVIIFLAKYLKAQVGILYLYDENKDELKLTASYAFSQRKSLNNCFKIGEGLVGQAAYEKEMISVTEIPEEYTRITSAMGDAAPRNILVVPFIHEEKLKGVIELGCLQTFSDTDLEFVRMVMENIAIAVSSAQSRTQTKIILEESQAQAEELTVQQEELREINEKLADQTSELTEQTTALKANEATLKIQKNNLEAANLTLNKTRREVERKAVQLEKSSKYKSEFLANMSHELRTPLNSMLILSQQLAQNDEKNLTDIQVESANIVYNSGKDLLNLINEILDLSKIEAGKMSITVEKIGLSSIAEIITSHFKATVDQKGLALRVNIAKNCPETITTDHQRLNQIIKNLISNAIKFTDQGSIFLDFHKPDSETVFTHKNLKPQKSIAISVIDTGIGIPKNKQEDIFQAFQQADGGISRKYGGTGLGLSISRELAKLLGGELQLHSEEGKGSTFTLYIPEKLKDDKSSKMDDVIQAFKLPQKKPLSEPLPPQTAKTPAQTAKTSVPIFSSPTQPILPPSQKEVADKDNTPIPCIDDDKDIIEQKNDKVILLIEDDLNFATILYHFAHQKGFKCLHAADGKKGLELAEKNRPDAIILDIRLPKIDGWHVLDALKDNLDIRHIPVHIISVEDKPLDILNKGAIGFLTKPVNEKELNSAFQKIEQLITHKIKQMLVIEDDVNHQKSLQELLGSSDIQITTAGTANAALQHLRTTSYDCMVLDLMLPDMSGFSILKTLEKEHISIPPVIIYTGRELNQEEHNHLQKYVGSVVIKGVKSSERLLDETALFLHRVVKELPAYKKEMIVKLHKKEMLKGKKILLIDDDMRNVFALSNVLQKQGMDILKAANGKDGLEILNKTPTIDLVITDIMMPIMNGYETMEAIRAQKRFKQLPIIALTAKAMKEDREKSIAAGASDYMVKPVEIDQLLSLLRVWLYK